MTIGQRVILGWMDQRRLSPAQPAPPSSFPVGEDLYDLLQGRFSSTTSASLAATSTSTLSACAPAATSLPDITSKPFLYRDPITQFTTDQINPPSGSLKMEPEIGDFMSNTFNWGPTTQLYNDSLSCLSYNSNQLSHPLPDAHFAYTPPPQPGQSSPQIQALRDFMVYGNLAGPTMQSPHLSSTVSSRATTPVASSLFYQLDDVSTDSLLGGPAVQSKPQDMSLAYRALCTEIYATERSPHRSQFQRENHILAERQRREEMNEKFSALRAMIPKATKKDKASIVGDTIDYVLELEKRLKQLQACKDNTSGSVFKSLKRKSPHGRCDDNIPESINAVGHDLTPDGLKHGSISDTNAHGPRAVSSPVREGHSAVSSPSDQITEESKLPGKNALAEVDVQNLGSQAVIKIICGRRPGHVLRVLCALEECKMEVLQSNVMTVADNSIHFVTVQLEDGVNAPTEELVSAVLQAINPEAQE